MKDYLQTISRWLGKKALLTIPVPLQLARKLTFLAALKPQMPLSPEALQMLGEAKQIYDPAPCRQLLNFQPREVKDFLMANPPSMQDRLATNLYFAAPALRLALAFMWIWTALVSLGLYPRQDSLLLLSRVGLGGSMAVFALYGAALLDLLLGFWVLSGRKVQRAIKSQLVLIIAYSATLSLFIPELWLHPFGPLLKNIPIMMAIIIWGQLEETA